MSASTITEVELFRAPAGKTWHVAKTAGFPVAVCGYTTPPNVDAVVESGVDSRAERHSKHAVCRNCRTQAAAAVEHDEAVIDGSDEHDAAVKSGKSAGRKRAKSNGSKPRASLSKADEQKLAEVADALSTGRGKLDRDAVVTVGRKLIKKAKGLRTSNPPVPAKLDRSDLPRIVEALDLPADLLGRAKDAS